MIGRKMMVLSPTSRRCTRWTAVLLLAACIFPVEHIQAFFTPGTSKAGISGVLPAAKSQEDSKDNLCLPVLGISLDAPASRRAMIQTGALVGLTVTTLFEFPSTAMAKKTPADCSDIVSCREIGERKVEQELKDNPTTSLPSGVQYKLVRPGIGEDSVQEGSTFDLIYSIVRGGGQYMYSKGFGFEKTKFGGTMQSDLGIDSLRVVVGQRNVPVGIEQALVGMKKGERRRVLLPPSVGFETSEWKPEPDTFQGKQSILAYQRILNGFGSQPPFAAPLIWDIEVLRIRGSQ